jgi:hypothetical protein
LSSSEVHAAPARLARLRAVEVPAELFRWLALG